MRCKIGGKIVDCKTVENLGYQGGRHARVVEHEGSEIVVVKNGGVWVQSVPSIQLGGGYTGQANTKGEAKQ